MASNPYGIKVIFFDVDGTLYSHSQQAIPQSTRDALAEVRAQGIQTVIATGRHKVDLQKLPTADLDFDGYLALNGQMVLDESMSLVTGKPIDAGEAEILAMAFKASKIPFVIITEDRKYMNYVDDLAQEAADKGTFIIPDEAEYVHHGENIFQLCAFVDDDQRALLDSILDQCDITSWSDTGIDIVPKGGGKAAGIARYLAAKDIKLEETMAFGDGENDVEMLKYVHIGVAMGNGVDDVREAADYVTAHIDDDGIAKALRHFGLID
jgi:Cof subfamily protein (haloacid dehalogenase superfamily)